MEIIGLFIILILVFVLPFIFKKVEEELEIFLFIMGVVSVTITRQWNLHLITEGLIEPIKITLAVLVAGILFNRLQHLLEKSVNKIENKLGLSWFIFLLVISLGLLSSIITAIIASLVLVEVVSHLKLDRKSEIKLVILSCFSIGFGAALTPIGEPLATIAISKLKGEPYHADFFFLMRRLWFYIVPSVLAFGILAVLMLKKASKREPGLKEDKAEDTKSIVIRAVKVYFFIMALVFLGQGFKPIIDMYVSKIHFYALYWINIISAILDNATLVAAEIGPSMDIHQIDAALLGLIISGGILIPGNIPNIIAASKLKIKSKEWAKTGVPVGLSFLIIFFILLIFLEK
jgi:predicted cation transporter